MEGNNQSFNTMLEERKQCKILRKKGEILTNIFLQEGRACFV